MGAIYDPTRDELFFAQKGKGAYLNKKKIQVSGVSVLQNSLLATGFTYNIKGARNKNIKNFMKFLMTTRAVRRAGSAALDLCYVACGRFDGFWELDLNPWDTAAGSLIVEEAGGKVSAFSGAKYSHYDKQLCASNTKIHNQMLKVLRRKK